MFHESVELGQQINKELSKLSFKIATPIKDIIKINFTDKTLDRSAT